MEILQGSFVAFFQSTEGYSDIGSPPDLRAGQCHLCGEIKQPQLPGLLLVGRNGCHDAVTHSGFHGLF